MHYRGFYGRYSDSNDVPDFVTPVTEIGALNLSVRSENGLRRAGINTIGDLEKMTTKELLGIRNLGKRSYDEIVSIKELNPYLDKTSIKDLQREQKRIKVKIEKLLDTAKTKDTSLTFEQLGFDSLVVDEAHNYKNGLVVSKMNNVSGVQTTAAQKSEDILMKTQYLNETYGTKNILFATGTPVFTPYQHSNTEFNINARFIGNRHNLNHR